MYVYLYMLCVYVYMYMYVCIYNLFSFIVAYMDMII